MTVAWNKTMIARLWRGIVRANRSEDYLRHLRERIIPAYRFANGSQSVHILFDVKGEFASILLLSFWDSHAALEAFSDPQLDSEISRAEREFILASESTTTVYEVIVDQSD